MRNYLLNEGWNAEEDSDVDYSSGEELADRKYHPVASTSKDADNDDDEESDDEEFLTRKLEEQEEEEEKKPVNIRELNFERDENREPKSYPRGDAISSVRVASTKAEKKAKKRAEKREKMKLNEQKYKEDLARQKNMKMQELTEKMEELKVRK